MPKKHSYCEECDVEFSVSYQKGFTVEYCPHCGSEIDQDWASTDEDDE